MTAASGGGGHEESVEDSHIQQMTTNSNTVQPGTSNDVHDNTAHATTTSRPTHHHRHRSPAHADSSPMKKRQLRELLSEIKKLLASRCNLDTMSSVNAMQMVATHLRRRPSTIDDAGTSAVDLFDSLGGDLQLAKCEREYRTSVTVRVHDMNVVSVTHDDESTSTLLSEDDCFLDIVHEADKSQCRRLIESDRPSASFICRLRHRTTDPATPNPIRITVERSAIIADATTDDNNNEAHCVTLSVAYLYSVYCNDRSDDQELRFSTKHSLDGKMTHVSDGCVPSLGLLPQQMVDESLFDYVHCDDTAVLMASLLSARVTPTSHVTWRCVCAHGRYVGLSSEWATYVNPWSRRVDMIVGVHRVISPPRTPDIFTAAAPPIETRLTTEAKSAVVHKLVESMSQTIVDVEPVRSPPTPYGVIQAPLTGLHVKAQRAAANQQHRHQTDVFSNISQEEVVVVGEQVEPLSLVVHDKKTAGNNDHTAVTPPQLGQQQMSHLFENVIEAMAQQQQQQQISYKSQLLHQTLTSRVPLLLGEALAMGGETSGTPAHHEHHMEHHMDAHHMEHSASVPLLKGAGGSQQESSTSPGQMSYTQINYLENVHRLLISTPRTGDHRHNSSPEYDTHIVPPPPPTIVTAPLAHGRSMSTCEQPSRRLTKETLHRHTQNCEREYKQSWKRRLSSQSCQNQNAGVVVHAGALGHPANQGAHYHPIIVEDQKPAKPKRQKRARGKPADAPKPSKRSKPSPPISQPKTQQSPQQQLQQPMAIPTTVLQHHPQHQQLLTSAPPLQVSSTVVTLRPQGPPTIHSGLATSSQFEVNRIVAQRPIYAQTPNGGVLLQQQPLIHPANQGQIPQQFAVQPPSVLRPLPMRTANVGQLNQAQLQQLVQQIQANGGQLPDVLQARLVQHQQLLTPQHQQQQQFRQPLQAPLRPMMQQTPQQWMVNNVAAPTTTYQQQQPLPQLGASNVNLSLSSADSGVHTADSSSNSQIKEVTDALMLLQELC